MTRVIGLTGYGGVGKDTLAALMHLQHGFTRYAFADRLKDVLRATDPIIHINEQTGEPFRLCELIEKIGWDDAKRIFPEVRRLLQRSAMGAREHISKQIWIDPVIKSINQRELAVVSDVRLPNEIAALRSAGWGEVTLVRLTRKGVKAVNGHVSEHAPLTVDIEFDLSEYTLEDMPKAANDLVGRVDAHWREIGKHKSRQRQALDDIIRNPSLTLGDRNLDAETLAHLSGKSIEQWEKETR